MKKLVLSFLLGAVALPAYANDCTSEQSSHCYPDVAADHWARVALNELMSKYHIQLGYPDGSFQGQRALTRYEMAALLLKVLAKSSSESADQAALDQLKAEFKAELESLKQQSQEELDGIYDRLDMLESDLMQEAESMMQRLGMQLPFRISGDLAFRYEHITPDITQFDTTISSTPQTRMTLSLDSLANDLPFAYGARLSVGNPRNPGNPWWRLGDYFARVDFALDRFFVSWRPTQNLDFTLGKFRNLYSQSELLMDFDVQPEGAFQRLHFDNLAPFLPNLAFTLGETIVNMNSLYQGNIFMLSAKGESRWQFGPSVSLDLNGAYHHWLQEALLYSSNQIASNNNQGARIVGNKNNNTPGTEFGIANGFARLNWKIADQVPLSLSFDYLNNLKASSKNQAFQAGVSLGGLQNPGDIQIAYFYKHLEADASVSYFVEDQLVGTDVMAHEGQLTVKAWDQTTLFATYQLSNGLSAQDTVRHTLRVGIHQAF